ncbi:hypothetical protein E2C01_012066 [Portunus trituberculatus]|uniref:Uncharacterized protein n=1 Tax=Portunus trituberculatus TaxID=210409 RepID=A0A5B7DCY8_PORTR|nr:hypothetical protein [Portunus trituberculatus]
MLAASLILASAVMTVAFTPATVCDGVVVMMVYSGTAVVAFDLGVVKLVVVLVDDMDVCLIELLVVEVVVLEVEGFSGVDGKDTVVITSGGGEDDASDVVILLANEGSSEVDVSGTVVMISNGGGGDDGGEVVVVLFDSLTIDASDIVVLMVSSVKNGCVFVVVFAVVSEVSKDSSTGYTACIE